VVSKQKIKTMLIKINELVKGDSFMLNSEGASTVYVTENIIKLSDCVVKVDAIGKLSGRKKSFTKVNSVRVIKF